MKTYVYLLIVLIPVYYFRIDVLPTNVFELLLAGALIAAIAIFAKEKRLPALNAKVILPSLLIISGLLLGLMISSDKLSTLGIIKSWFLVPILMYWLVSAHFKAESVKYVTNALTVSAVLVAAYVSLQWLGHIGPVGYQIGDANFLRYVAEDRATGFYESPNYAAMYLAPLLFVSLLGTKNWRDPKLAGSLLILLALFATGSRGAILATVLAAVTLMSVYKFGLRGGLVSMGSFLLILLGSFFALSSQLGASDGIRIEYYSAALEIIKSHILTGVGAGQFHSNFVSLCGSTQLGCSADSSALHAHNLYLELLLAGGILLLSGFVILVTITYKNMFTYFNSCENPQERFRIATVGAAILVILLHGTVDTTYFKNDLAVVFWLLVLVCHTYSGHVVPKLGRT